MIQLGSDLNHNPDLAVRIHPDCDFFYHSFILFARKIYVQFTNQDL